MNIGSKLDKEVASAYANTGAIVVLKDGETVYERYYAGYAKESSFHVFSVTKSILSMLVGIAADQGKVNINQTVLSYFPYYSIKRGEKTIGKVTVKDMLTMTAPYKYRYAPYTKYFKSDDWVKSSLDLLGGKGKIGQFRYAPLIGPDILSGILVRAMNKPVLQFAREFLFGPLGIQVGESIVFKDKKEQMDWYKKKDPTGWVADPKGVNTAGWGLCLTAMDMAKLGQLYLDEGMHQGRRIVSSDWVRDSTREHSRWEERNLMYGYLWWVIEEADRSFAAMGDGGNTIYVNPRKRIVVSIGASFKPRARERISLIKEYVEPYV